VSLAIGSETDGSIVCPASLNGVVGLKPTVGSISVHGVVPISESQDTPGPLTTDVRLAALAFEVMSGTTGVVAAVDNSAELCGSFSVGVAEAWLTGHTETDALFAKTVEVIKSVVKSVGTSAVPAAGSNEHTDEYTVLKCELKDDLGRYLTERLGASHPLTSLAAVVDFNREHADRELQHFGQEIFEAAIATEGRSGKDYTEARQRNLDWALNTCFGPAFAEFDLLVAPAYGPAWKSDLVIGERGFGGVSSTAAAIAGYPLLCIPMGLVQGLPVGLIISGKAHDEARMLALGAELMKRLGTRPEDGFVPSLARATRG
jgi:amidase